MAVNQPIRVWIMLAGNPLIKNSTTRLWAMFNYSIEEVKLLQSDPHFSKKKKYTIRHSFKFLKYS